MSQGVASASSQSPSELLARADVFATAGSFGEAIRLYRHLLTSAPDDSSLFRKLAGALQAQGAAGEAVLCYRRAVTLDPGDARAHDELGRLLAQHGDPRSAAEHLIAAVRAEPRLASAHGALGDLLCRDGRWQEGVAELRAALALDANNWVLNSFLGSALAALGPERLGEAMDCFRRVIALAPNNATAHLQLGLAFWARGDTAPAIALAERAVRLEPTLAAGHSALGGMLRNTGRNDDAVVSLRRALELVPTDADALFHLAVCLSTRDDSLREGLDCFQRVIDLAPDRVQAHVHLGSMLALVGLRDRARAVYRDAAERFPEDPAVAVGATMAELSILAEDDEAMQRSRADYTARLEALEKFFLARRNAGVGTSRRDAEAVGSAQPFFLAYQGRSDRELQAAYGRIVTGVMSAAYPEWSTEPTVAPLAPGEPIRVAIVSGHFWAHSVLKIPIWGWVSLLDRSRFRLLGYHTCAKNDVETARIRRSFDRFVQGPLTLEQWCKVIRADEPHVVIFPEIGMDPMTPRLAGLRLARVQCCSWGHPTTSGFPTIDYFLSSERMEPPDAESHYTERLVRLPNLGVTYVPPPIPAVPTARSELGLREGSVAYWCCQLLSKYTPRSDGVLARIARRVHDAQFVFIASPRGDEIVERFRQRLARAFAAEGLDVDRHVVILPRLSTPAFLGAAAACDVFLDAMDWSGCNSALECLAAGLPIVTTPGPLMRARHCLAILQMLGVTETVASNVDEYVETAVRLGLDPGLRAELREKMSAGRQRLYADPSPVRALESWLESVVARTTNEAHPATAASDTAASIG